MDFNNIKEMKEHRKYVRKIKDEFIKQNPDINHELAFEILERIEKDQWIRGKNWLCKGNCSEDVVNGIKKQKGSVQ